MLQTEFFVSASELGITTVNTHLVSILEILAFVDVGHHFVAADLPYGIAVGSSVRAVLAPPPAARHRAGNEFADSVGIMDMLDGVRVAADYSGITTGAQDIQHLGHVGRLVNGALERNMNAQDNQFACGDRSKVLLQPGYLAVGKVAVVLAGMAEGFETHIEHRHNVRVSPVERIVCGAEHVFKITVTPH